MGKGRSSGKSKKLKHERDGVGDQSFMNQLEAWADRLSASMFTRSSAPILGAVGPCVGSDPAVAKSTGPNSAFRTTQLRLLENPQSAGGPSLPPKVRRYGGTEVRTYLRVRFQIHCTKKYRGTWQGCFRAYGGGADKPREAKKPAAGSEQHTQQQNL